MKQRVFNLIILDQSGSMCSIARETVNGLNETMQTIRSAQRKHPEQQHFVSLVAFNSDEQRYLYDLVEAERAEDLSADRYRPACCTPLYDAMGNAITRLAKHVADTDAVLVTIITDGYENASVEYDNKSIKALVESFKNKNWIFTYIGANQDVEKVAMTISVTNTLNFSADGAGTQAMFAKESKSRARFFDRLSGSELISNIRDDYFE